MDSLKNPKLEFLADDSELLQNNYSLLKLIIINNGELVAKDISIKLLTEIEAPKNSKLEVNHEDFPRILSEIKPGERKEIHFEFYPITAGRASLTILDSCKTAEGKCLLEKKDEFYVMIQPDISKPPVVIEDDLINGFDSYRKQATAVFSKGKNITDNERGMLDVIRITCNLTKEQQRQIEDEILKKYSGVRSDYDSLKDSFEGLEKLSISPPDTKEIENAIENQKNIEAAMAIEKLRGEVESQISNSRPSLHLKLQKTNFLPNVGTKTQILIHNDGNTPAKNVSLNFSGEVAGRLLSRLELLNPGESKTIEIWIKPMAEGDLPLDVLMKYKDGLERSHENKEEIWIFVGDKTSSEEESNRKKNQNEIEIRRGFFILPNNDIKFGVRITNATEYSIMDVSSILDFTKTLFSSKDSEIQHIGNLTPNTTRTATHLLKPLGCIHKEQINALISFKGINVEDLAKFMGETCRHVLYEVKEYDLEGKKVIYLSGEALGEKAYYLLTAVIQEYKGLTQVVLRAHSDKKYGLYGFMNEMAGSIRHLVGSVQNAKEIGIIENSQVINIIDSVVQRTNIGDDRRKNEF